MDALDKLAAKNAQHDSAVKAERLIILLVSLGLLPFYIDIGYAVWTDLTFPERHFYLLISGVSCFFFSGLLMAFGELMRMRQWLKWVLFLISLTWFSTFWIFGNHDPIAFMPLIPAFILIKLKL
ncbi:hypothetical protein CBX96_11900 [Shewanella sp. BC20]|nr:hypothetical protein CBX96_11900 [Shewanella sp. BC20]